MRVTEEQIHLIETTFRALGGNGHEFIEGLYQKIFKEVPMIEAMFSHADWQQQRSKFMSVLIMIVDNLHDIEHVEAMLQNAIKAHNSYPISDKHYDLMTKAILETFPEILGDKWTEKAEIAWNTVLDDIMTILKNTHKG